MIFCVFNKVLKGYFHFKNNFLLFSWYNLVQLTTSLLFSSYLSWKYKKNSNKPKQNLSKNIAAKNGNSVLANDFAQSGGYSF